MVPDVVLRSPDRLRIGRTTAGIDRHMAFVEALSRQRSGHFREELVIEPAHQPAHFDARAGIGWQQATAVVAADLVEIFGDDGGTRYRRMTFVDQYRRGSRGIDDQKVA